TIISAIVLVGYLYDTPLLYGGSVIPVAFSTACGFFLCGIAIMTAPGAEDWPLGLFMGDSTRAMGIFPTARYTTATRSMAKGDLIMLFTDGLFEVEDSAGAFFAEEQQQASVSRQATLVSAEF